LTEGVQATDELAVILRAHHGDVQFGKVPLQDRAVDLVQPVDAVVGSGEELPDRCDRGEARQCAPSSTAAAKPPANPSLGQLFEPWLGNAVKA
jgi:hypothetical protein